MRCWFLCLQMFVEVWLHHYSLDMYQKLQSPQVKVRALLLPLLILPVTRLAWPAADWPIQACSPSPPDQLMFLQLNQWWGGALHHVSHLKLQILVLNLKLFAAVLRSWSCSCCFGFSSRPLHAACHLVEVVEVLREEHRPGRHEVRRPGWFQNTLNCVESKTSDINEWYPKAFLVQFERNKLIYKASYENKLTVFLLDLSGYGIAAINKCQSVNLKLKIRYN